MLRITEQDSSNFAQTVPIWKFETLSLGHRKENNDYIMHIKNVSKSSGRRIIERLYEQDL